jgi:hypothetical protein
MATTTEEIKVIENTQPANVDKKPRGRPKKENKIIRSKEEMRAYYKTYFEEHKDQIMQKRAEYRKTDKYKQLRHEQNARYKAKCALKPKVCLIDIKSLEPQRVCLIKL